MRDFIFAHKVHKMEHYLYSMQICIFSRTIAVSSMTTVSMQKKGGRNGNASAYTRA